MKERKPSSLLDRSLLILFVIGAIAMAFIAGTYVQYYRYPPSKTLSNAYNAAQTWWKTLQEPGTILEIKEHENKNPVARDEKIISNPRIPIWNKKTAYNGYTLVSTGFFDSAFLIDMQGKIVHRWDMPFRKAWPNPAHVHLMTKADTFLNYAYLFPNGDLLAQYAAIGDTPYGYGILKMDKNSKVLWTYNENAHHDLYVDKENGNIYALIHKMIKEPVKGAESLRYPMLADYIVKLSPDGKELERVSLLEAFRDSPFAHMLYHEKNGGLATWDHFHTNSIVKLEPSMADKFPMFKPGQILVSVRGMNAIAMVDMKAKKVAWAYNGSWKMQHAAHFLPNGHILLFDNNGHVMQNRVFSRIIEFDPKTLEVKWMYAGDKDRNFRSSIVGRVQRLPNGNTLIAESMQARMIEVTPDGDTVWQYELQKIRRSDPTLNAILSSTRYHESEIPFLKQKPKK